MKLMLVTKDKTKTETEVETFARLDEFSNWARTHGHLIELYYVFAVNNDYPKLISNKSVDHVKRVFARKLAA